MSEQSADNKRAEILQVAEILINGDRAQSYGPPEESFGRIAELLNALGFRHESYEGKLRGLNGTDVAMALIQLKVSRLVNSPDHEDSWVDIAGYAGLGAEIALRPKLSVDQKANTAPVQFIRIRGKKRKGAYSDTQCLMCYDKLHHVDVQDHMDNKHPQYYVFTIG